VKAPIAAVALCSAAVFGAAPPAFADAPPKDGAFTYLDENGQSATWIIRTTCSPDCVAQVTTSPGHGFTAPLIDGRPTATRSVPDGVTCPSSFIGDSGSLRDGGVWPVTVRQSWDPGTLHGDVYFLDSPSPCGIPVWHQTFTLMKIG